MDALAIISDAARDASDTGYVRWSKADWMAYLNEAIRNLVKIKPDTNPVTETIELAQGIRQQIPEKFSALMSANYSMPSGRSVRLVDGISLRALLPFWMGEDPTDQVEEYFFDPKRPRELHVYPPAIAGSQLEITASELPDPLVVPADPENPATIWPDFPLHDSYADIVRYFMLARAYSTPTGGGEQNRSRQWLETFYQSIGMKAEATNQAGPESE